MGTHAIAIALIVIALRQIVHPYQKFVWFCFSQYLWFLLKTFQHLVCLLTFEAIDIKQLGKHLIRSVYTRAIIVVYK